MVQRKVVSIAVVSILLMFVFGNNLSYSQQAQEPEEPDAPDIQSWTQVPEDHQEIELATPCMMCHNYKVDATTTATKQMVRIGKQLEKDVLLKRIFNYLDNGTRTKTFVLGTSLNNVPLTTTCDWMFDPKNKFMYAFFEIGTEKLLHVRGNPLVSLNRHKEWENNFSTVLCIQVRGKAKLFDGSSPVFDEAVQISFPGLPEEMRKELSERAKKNMVVCRVTIDQIVLFDGTLLGQGMSSYQMWRRVDTFTPEYFTQKDE
jgi:hypothetical protein